MRITQIYVKDAVSVSEYAYSEDKNSPARHEMEDSTSSLSRLRSLR